MFAKSFTRSLEKLDGQSQTLVKLSLADFLMNPKAPGFQFHRVDNTKDEHFWSFRVNQDLRVIVHYRGGNSLFLYADHHDAAYTWAERRQIEVHPTTGAAQLVEIEEVTREVVKTIVREVEREQSLFGHYERDYLLALGVPPRWLDAVMTVGTTGFYDIIDRLPEEAAERLLLLSEGQPVPVPAPVPDGDPFEHPDAQRRFSITSDHEELQRALDYPWEQWMVFLHPLQREVAERNYSGPARVSGSAGTGKTVVALHRVAKLYKQDPQARILLTTFSKALAARLRHKLKLLLGDDENVETCVTVANLHKVARDIWVEKAKAHFHRINDDQLKDLLHMAERSVPGTPFSYAFLKSEWDAIIDPLGVTTWEQYRSVPRVGRGTPLGARQRKAIWDIFERVLLAMAQQGLMTFSGLCHKAAGYLEAQDLAPFNHVVVDESQDFGPAELQLCRALVHPGANDLFMCGDMGQRIYQGRFSWLSQGIDVRGRSACLRVNYRTTEQIRSFADKLLPTAVADGDGGDEERASVSLLKGPEPQVVGCKGTDDEIELVAHHLKTLLENGYSEGDIAIFARSREVLQERAEAVLDLLELDGEHLKNEHLSSGQKVSLGSMHIAKGLEFRAVVVMGCDQDLLPLRVGLQEALDDTERAAFTEQERQLLYVACTRAREHVLLTYSGMPSPFLNPMD